MDKLTTTRRDLLLATGLLLSASAVPAAEEACSVFTKARQIDAVKLGNPTATLAKIRPAVSAVSIQHTSWTSANKRFVQSVAAQNVRNSCNLNFLSEPLMSTRKSFLLAATALLLMASAGLTTTSHAAQLVNGNGACTDIQRNDTHDGTPVILFHCHGTPNENWVLSAGTFAGEDGVCLDVLGSEAKDGAQIIVVQCNGRPSQKWQIINGQVIGSGNKCLDLLDGSTADRTPLVLATCNPSSTSQQWTLQ